MSSAMLVRSMVRMAVMARMRPRARSILSFRLTAAERRRLSFKLKRQRCVGIDRAVEQELKIPVAQPVDGEFPAIYGLEKVVVVGLKGMQRAYPAARGLAGRLSNDLGFRPCGRRSTLAFALGYG